MTLQEDFNSSSLSAGGKLPETTEDMSTDQIYYSGNSSLSYLNSQKNLSTSLVTISTAYWKNLYLQNEETLSPLLLSVPSSCPQKAEIETSVTTYLEQVKNVSAHSSFTI